MSAISQSAFSKDSLSNFDKITGHWMLCSQKVLGPRTSLLVSCVSHVVINYSATDIKHKLKAPGGQKQEVRLPDGVLVCFKRPLFLVIKKDR